MSSKLFVHLISKDRFLEEAVWIREFEPRASVRNVSEITAAGLMGVNTVADGEPLRS